MDEDLRIIYSVWHDLTPWQRKTILARARWFVFQSKTRSAWDAVKANVKGRFA